MSVVGSKRIDVIRLLKRTLERHAGARCRRSSHAPIPSAYATDTEDAELDDQRFGYLSFLDKLMQCSGLLDSLF